MVGRRGWVRAAEASLASLLIIGVIAFLLANNILTSKESHIGEDTTRVLREMAENNTLREMIVHEDSQATDAVNSFISSRISISFYEFEVVICGVDEECVASSDGLPASKSVYAAHRIISSSIDGTINPKIVKVYVWEKG